MTTDQKARQVAEEVVRQWCGETVTMPAGLHILRSLITQAILQFAQEQEDYASAEAHRLSQLDDEATTAAVECGFGDYVTHAEVIRAMAAKLKQESEAVRELVDGLEPFARSINEELADEKALYVSLDDVYLRVGPTVGHCRKAAALIARHSKGAV